MAHIILKWALNTLGIYITSLLFKGINLDNPWVAPGASIVLTLVNTKVRPFLIAVTLSINILSLGFFTLAINALMFWLASLLTPGFSCGVAASFWGAILISIISFTGDIIYEECAGIHYGWRERGAALSAHQG